MSRMLPIVIIALALPLAAIGLILVARRSQSIPKLTLAFVLSGIIGAALTAMIAFMNSTVPIAPYETGPGAWSPIIGLCFLSLFVGFGLGVIVAALAVSPYLLVKILHKR